MSAYKPAPESVPGASVGAVKHPVGVERKLLTVFRRRRTVGTSNTPATVTRTTKPQQIAPGDSLERCLKCGSTAMFEKVVGCCKNRVRIYRCKDCGWYAVQPVS